ncbi:acyl-CoA thioesterase [Alicyclobacillus fastidiosus]|uniref:Thioesterase family protein n=1 Tax=Alicyclobacillus fastidiosus TaxID=392011 RepID=A0ABV5ABT7_9BACL|nr:thioesterase family protein [Alicyclobacillus fastidiosus]WEH10376.1 thioesterase family protein [Alicyclobacillus fastidiosus]
MDNYRYHHELRVRFSEVDGQRIVFNANYLSYLDLAYSEYLRRELRVSGGMPSTVLAKSTIQFRQSATFDDVLKIWVRTVRIGTSSMTVEFTITRDGEVLFEAENIYVYIGEGGKPAPVPEAWRQTIEAYEQGR